MPDAKQQIASMLAGGQPQQGWSLADIGRYFSPSNQEWAPWPVRAVRGGLAALAAPGDAYSGDLPMVGGDGHTSLEAIGRGADLAGLMTLGATGAPRGALGSGAVLPPKGYNKFAKKWISSKRYPAGTTLDSLDKHSRAFLDQAWRNSRASVDERIAMQTARDAQIERQMAADEAAKDAATASRTSTINDIVDAIVGATGGKTSSSSLSNSRYVMLPDGRKVRIADHELPPTYERLNGRPDLDIAVGYRGGDFMADDVTAIAQILAKLK